ncbi:hypothetical protein IQ258_26705 [Coleofasciculus sp. LEGE 07081]|nr:hypothetical protein [Coleofasciculus sp. LEGE 07081]MBE9129640.1 hypothetical protein [Coleofasciculus sp. LEGE 07081]
MTIKTTNNNDQRILINLERKWQFICSARSFRVYIDDSQAGRIKPGTTEEYEVFKGEHTIEIKIDMCKSEPFKISALTDKSLHLRCGLNALALLNFRLDEFLIIESIFLSRKSKISPVLLESSVGILYGVITLLLIAGFIFYPLTTLGATIVIFSISIIKRLSKNKS